MEFIADIVDMRARILTCLSAGSPLLEKSLVFGLNIKDLAASMREMDHGIKMRGEGQPHMLKSAFASTAGI